MFEASFSNDNGKLGELQKQAGIDEMLDARHEISPEEYTAALDRRRGDYGQFPIEVKSAFGCMPMLLSCFPYPLNFFFFHSLMIAFLPTCHARFAPRSLATFAKARTSSRASTSSVAASTEGRSARLHASFCAASPDKF